MITLLKTNNKAIIQLYQERKPFTVQKGVRQIAILSSDLLCAIVCKILD